MASKRLRHSDTFKRKSSVREERIPTIDKDKIVISFKDFDGTQPRKQPQGFQDWENEEILVEFLEKLPNLCEMTMQEAKNKEMITEYGEFPDAEGYKIPNKLKDKELRWAVLKKLTGQKARVAGHIIDNVFYIVFLDKNHKFWPVETKHT
jgi:hypothetical protein